MCDNQVDEEAKELANSGGHDVDLVVHSWGSSACASASSGCGQPFHMVCLTTLGLDPQAVCKERSVVGSVDGKGNEVGQGKAEGHVGWSCELGFYTP